MPVYSFRCSKCGYEFDQILCISQRNKTQKCEMCLGPADRDVESELAGVDGTVTENHERWSWSMGCTAVQAKEVLKDHPELEGDFKHGKNGGPLLVHNRQDKLRKMSIFGMQEY